MEDNFSKTNDSKRQTKRTRLSSNSLESEINNYVRSKPALMPMPLSKKCSKQVLTPTTELSRFTTRRPSQKVCPLRPAISNLVYGTPSNNYSQEVSCLQRQPLPHNLNKAEQFQTFGAAANPSVPICVILPINLTVCNHDKPASRAPVYIEQLTADLEHLSTSQRAPSYIEDSSPNLQNNSAPRAISYLEPPSYREQPSGDIRAAWKRKEFNAAPIPFPTLAMDPTLRRPPSILAVRKTVEPSPAKRKRAETSNEQEEAETAEKGKVWEDFQSNEERFATNPAGIQEQKPEHYWKQQIYEEASRSRMTPENVSLSPVVAEDNNRSIFSSFRPTCKAERRLPPKDYSDFIEEPMDFEFSQ